ncbi:hypothetical protein Tco_0293708, partial [Tanacetum coccineum]
DSLPVDEAVDFRTFTETDVRPTFLRSNDEGRDGIVDFVKSTNPFKVKVGERTLAENEVLLLTETKDAVLSLFAQPISLVDYTIEDELKANTGKKKRKVSLMPPSPVKKVRIRGINISEPIP